MRRERRVPVGVIGEEMGIDGVRTDRRLEWIGVVIGVVDAVDNVGTVGAADAAGMVDEVEATGVGSTSIGA